MARVSHRGATHYLGTFRSEEEAEATVAEHGITHARF
jgi:hypothetical protein